MRSTPARAEPLAAHVINSRIEGDFVEAGVFTGGISVFMAAMLCAHSVLGDSADQRKLWMADSFAGMPSEGASSRLGRTSEGFKSGTLVGTMETVSQNFVHLGGQANARKARESVPQSKCRLGGVPQGAHFLRGWFNETLPGPIRRVALLRVDSDLYVSINDTLSRLYPLLQPGGYVIFDDFKFTQAQEAILEYRQAHGITSALQRSSWDLAPPFRSLDQMVYWQKRVHTG